MNSAILKPHDAADATMSVEERVGVLLPLPLAGPYDYRIGAPHERGTMVIAPLGPREALGVVWSDGEGKIDTHRLREAVPFAGAQPFPRTLCDFIDWVARYTLSPQGAVLALALRARQAFEDEVPRVAYVRGSATPARMT